MRRQVINPTKEPSSWRKYVFNALGGAMDAVVMFFLQLLVTRIIGPDMAGAVSIDTASVLLCYYIGSLNMRSYQCTDLEERFSFSEYLTLKTLSCLLMCFACACYIFVRGYTGTRLCFCACFCIYKAIGTFSDCSWGMFQQKNRIDLAGLGGLLHGAFSLCAFGVTLIISQNLSLSAVMMAISAITVFFFYTFRVTLLFERVSIVYSHAKRILNLFSILFPVFLCVILQNFVISIPKYSLEQVCPRSIQALFAAVFMPAQVITLFSNFIFMPRITTLAQYAIELDGKKYVRLLLRLVGTIVILDILAMICGWLVGIQVLGAMYKLDLSEYRDDLVIILLGGGFYALFCLGYYAVVAIRRQKGIFLIPALTVAMAILVNGFLVPRYYVFGASAGYAISTLFMTLLMYVWIWKSIRKVFPERVTS